MRFIDQILIAFKHLKQRLLESFIIILAILLGTAVICLAFALTLGTQEQLKKAEQEMEYSLRVTSAKLDNNS